MKTNTFLLFMLIPFLVIVGFFGFKFFTVTTGTEIILEVPRPIDPVDLFRGNYVTLGYSISVIENISGFENSKDETVHALLSKKEKYWTIDEVSREKLNPSENQVCMKGTITHSWNASSRGWRDSPSGIRINWGIESYFASPDIAKEIEDGMRLGSVASIVAVDNNCNSVLRGMIVNETIYRTN